MFCRPLLCLPLREVARRSTTSSASTQGAALGHCGPTTRTECDVKAAFAACKAKRKVVSLNKKMRRALTEWQERYVVAK